MRAHQGRPARERWPRERATSRPLLGGVRHAARRTVRQLPAGPHPPRAHRGSDGARGGRAGSGAVTDL